MIFFLINYQLISGYSIRLQLHLISNISRATIRAKIIFYYILLM